MKYIDRKLKEYYEDAYHGLLSTNITFEIPILSKFIIQNTPKGMNSVEYALHLKNEGLLVSYRQYLAEIEDAIQNQNYKDLRILLNDSIEAIEDVVKIDKKSILKTNVTIIPMPSLSVKPDFKLLEKRIHLNFIRDLTKFALSMSVELADFLHCIF